MGLRTGALHEIGKMIPPLPTVISAADSNNISQELSVTISQSILCKALQNQCCGEKWRFGFASSGVYWLNDMGYFLSIIISISTEMRKLFENNKEYWQLLISEMKSSIQKIEHLHIILFYRGDGRIIHWLSTPDMIVCFVHFLTDVFEKCMDTSLPPTMG